jgi:hypothetical protein
MISLSDAAGLFGISLSIYCYARVQWQRDFAKRFSYSVLNLLSAIFLGISLAHNWNLASFVSNIIWGGISAYGIYRCSKYVWRARIAARRPHDL